MLPLGNSGIGGGDAQAATLDVAEPGSLRACPDRAYGTKKRTAGGAAPARDD